jgi:hypothetical protein
MYQIKTEMSIAQAARFATFGKDSRPFCKAPAIHERPVAVRLRRFWDGIRAVIYRFEA